jgi:site-specific recombinase XerD
MGRGVAGRVVEVGVAGPLSPFAAEFGSRLAESGYAPLTVVRHLRVMADLSRWLEGLGLGVGDLGSGRVEQYLRGRRAAGRSAACSRRALAPLLKTLAGLGVLPAEPPGGLGLAAEVLLASFGRYLLQERALAPCTAAAYVSRARRFLARCAPGGGVAGLTAADVTGAVLAEAEAVSPGSAQYFVAALRSFLRFCFIEGLVGADLSAAALAVTGRRHWPLPQGLSPASARALLRSCDRRRGTGRRDYAILVVLLRLGLRASEVAGLTLDDIDWRAGEIVVHGKGGREDGLPLPWDAGEAIAGYLQRGRPASGRREVFLRALAPAGPLGRGGVSSIVRRACVRAGVPPVGAHRLRHTAAGQMVAAGVPLPEIGQVLRHRSVASTAAYARVDLGALRAVARPWPGSGQR